MGVVQEPVDGRGCEGLGHQLVKRGGVKVRRDRHRAFLVRGVDQAVQAFGRVLGYRQQANVINLCGYPHRLIYADTVTMPRRGLYGLSVQVIGEARLGIVTGPRGTRAPCPAGGSGRVAPKRVW